MWICIDLGFFCKATATTEIFTYCLTLSLHVALPICLGTKADLDRAVEAAKAAQPGWAAVNPQRRSRVMVRFKELVEQNIEELARTLSSEHGKVIADARGDVPPGFATIEFACGLPHAPQDVYTTGAGPGIELNPILQ